MEAVEYFSPYLYGQEFTIFTDHKPLCSLLTSDHLNSHLKRFSTKLQPWMIKFQYLPGEENTFADALSRQDWRRSGEANPTVEKIPDSNSREGDKEEDETGATELPQSGVGGCGGPAPQEEKGT